MYLLSKLDCIQTASAYLRTHHTYVKGAGAIDSRKLFSTYRSHMRLCPGEGGGKVE